MAMNQDTLKRYGSKEGFDAEVLIDSRAVLAKDDFVATGILTYAQGDIMEIELPEYDVFQLGDKAKMTLYTKSGLFVLDTTVVAREPGSLIVINPPENRKKFSEKREFPRVNVKNIGQIFGFQNIQQKEQYQLEQAIEISIKNISMSGLGFTINDSSMIDAILHKKCQLQVQLDLGFEMPCMLEIIRKEKQEGSYYYGASFESVPAEQSNALRGFILRNQIQTYFEQKRDEEYKKALEKKSGANQ
ncbi:PilZ domain-containing protein [Paenibacillus qinlingensis]|uniref:C-di-GMP-binding flagellar brake protein YcgR n=1 Tax=Paenibacillus qinlingensis TaxID=1837343 RepID=A0ABU1P1R6_9BACL|nr:PilZ domain-containing protein [Paenibacillus qinlingensis]MDR6553685.1 c-di-GMP-binding flagellar brake protein YcgR [Paenibacillus qinlingensis]